MKRFLSPLPLPDFAQHRVDELARALMLPDNGFDFTVPHGEEALVPADSVSWRIFKNPLSVFIGGVAAVLLELAEPRVRTGVWEHSSFRNDPGKQLQRTGLAAMITIYGPRRAAEEMIAGVGRLHEKVSGLTPAGEPYHASDPELLTWVQATASFGFMQAYDAYVWPLSSEKRDALYHEALPAARLYGATDAPVSDIAREILFDSMAPRLEPSPILDEFLAILRAAPAFPAPLRPMQHLLIRAAVSLVPNDLRAKLQLKNGLRTWEYPAVRGMCALADHVLINTSPAVQSCRRLGLPANFLYRQ